MMQVHCVRTDQGIGFTVMVGVWGLMSSQRISILFLKLTYGMDVFLQYTVTAARVQRIFSGNDM